MNLTASEKSIINSIGIGDTFTCEIQYFGIGEYKKLTYRVKNKVENVITAKTDDNNYEIIFDNGEINNFHNYRKFSR